MINDLSLNHVGTAREGTGGYDLWFDLPPKSGDATMAELQMLCQGAILVGRIGRAMGWDWRTLLRNVRRLSAPFEDYILLEVETRAFRSARFRRVLHDCVPAAGLDPYKIKVSDSERAGLYILGHGLPPI